MGLDALLQYVLLSFLLHEASVLWWSAHLPHGLAVLVHLQVSVLVSLNVNIIIRFGWKHAFGYLCSFDGFASQELRVLSIIFGVVSSSRPLAQFRLPYYEIRNFTRLGLSLLALLVFIT